MFRIHPETDKDNPEVEYLFDLAFAPGRGALSSYRLRQGVAPLESLSLVMRDQYDILAGAIRYWPIVIGQQQHPALLLGPIAIHPTRQGEGLGHMLINQSLKTALSEGWLRVVLVGDERYYKRFGFSRILATGLEYPPPTDPARLLARALVKGAFENVSGIITKPPLTGSL